MNTIVFDGRAFASKKEKELQREVAKLKKKGIIPKLTSILVGNNPASTLYVFLKKRTGERIGANVEILKFDKSVRFNELLHQIKNLNDDKSVHGIMVQLPFPEIFTEKDRNKIINSIAKEKDVDGLRDNSPFLTPTVKSVIFALKDASAGEVKIPLKEAPYKVVVVGYTGFEGGKIYKVLKEMGYEVTGADSKTKDLKLKTQNADIVISATGSPGIIKGNMIKDGAIVIDVGAPKGDVDKEKVIGKAGFLSPVPGGIGPVTIVSLLENLIASCS
jgi:methylenetetrahydrofolate dehydrogenase (NADP+)/methenyltetrahydrofolate cyclohydrolase